MGIVVDGTRSADLAANGRIGHCYRGDNNGVTDCLGTPLRRPSGVFCPRRTSFHAVDASRDCLDPIRLHQLPAHSECFLPSTWNRVLESTDWCIGVAYSSWIDDALLTVAVDGGGPVYPRDPDGRTVPG